ncbi:uncharacterized protein H6S33_008250 [Morchella sextelata]|uniref:uncharacterized protein n=1 Tax=Morchella sextelata TaxID=1174677 RepID=UPI001D038F75|nr:uncharacterized protein H6S33_008250 [Morchella sextelata]KAH0603246.1 hypothetical protein H6S33_008250 [Morchella sextelata]
MEPTQDRIRRELYGRKTTDHELLVVLGEIYYGKLRPRLQRFLSVRGLKHIVIVECTNEEHPVPLRISAALRRDLIHVFKKPNLISTEDRWINLICELGEDPHHDYGLLFLDDWDGQKIAVLVGVPLIVSILTAILWIASTGDIQNAMAVSTYILSATGVVVGLLAVLGTIDD